MLSIPKFVLSAMSDEEVIAAVYSYPYLVDIYLYGNSVADGIEVARSYFSALDELLSRETGLDSLYIMLANISQKLSTARSTSDQSTYDFAHNALTDIYFAASNISHSVMATGSIYTNTPMGSRVNLEARTEYHSSDFHEYIDIQQIVDVYNVTLIEPGSCLYNCHYFAWYAYGEIPTDPYWMSDPSAYMTDGSYTCTYSGDMYTKSYDSNIAYGDIIFYGYVDGDIGTWHSAIYQSNSGSSSPVGAQHCISKWGQYGIFDHAMGNVPAGYDASLITAWR